MANDWEVVSLVEHCKKIGSGATPRGGSSVYLEEGEITLIRSQNVYNEGFKRDGLVFITEEAAEKLKNVIVEENDILLNITGDSVARVCMVDNQVLPARVNQHVSIIRPKESSFNPSYLRYQLVSPQVQQLLLNYASAGATRHALTKSMIENLGIPKPDLDTQNNIAHILGSLDDKIELNRQMNETLEAMAQTLFKSWVVDFDPVIDNALAAGNAIPDEFIERAEQRKAIKEKDSSDIQALFPDEFEFTEEMGWIPKGWEAGSLDNMFELQRGFDLPKTKRTDGLYPLMAASGQDGTHDEYKVKGPGVITGRSGKLGVVSFVNANYWPLNTTLWVKNYNQSNPYHAYFFLQTLDLEKYNSGSAVPSLNRNNVHNLAQILPSKIVLDKFQEVVKSSFAKIAENNTGIETVAKLRDTLLPKLMSGELRIPDAEALVDEAI